MNSEYIQCEKCLLEDAYHFGTDCYNHGRYWYKALCDDCYEEEKE